MNLVPRRSTRKSTTFLSKSPHDDQTDIPMIPITWNPAEFKGSPTPGNSGIRTRKQSGTPLSYHNTMNSTNVSGPTNTRNIRNSPGNEPSRNKMTTSTSERTQKKCWKTLQLQKNVCKRKRT
ncbi:hypothetical protein FOXG_22637 [Fusarium oxysporum f. sp. lycopersici 4287]|uniref:Uncharacterized protein n=1 Tax=Fusarium oxysporum f. sp. lycopersici (strain 4287 / CBS 123668 / FGSC 9935 / NRRL 34936) TaxID=426428 RepID=A0A0J9WA57_FUSO4|nr:hypothetical protein FOXG_22637 [Fusarium oxysporum f. sp. lycopersici 4287]KNB19723.1 hypothetical protein FOXG_22637 [Fusarium oxysporum f. sp. lycopersici 4287]